MKSLGDPRRESILTPDPSHITVQSLGGISEASESEEEEEDYGGMKGY